MSGVDGAHGAGATSPTMLKPMTFPLAFKTGTKYRARILLGFFEKIASNETIADKFITIGFPDAVCTGEGAERFVDGTWTGPDQIFASKPDAHIQGVWEIT